MRQWLAIFLIVSSIWGCSSTEKSSSTPEGLYKQAEEYRNDERYELAIQRYQELKNKFPYSSYAIQAELAIADTYYKQESYAEAQVSYQSFKDLHPKHSKTDYSLFQLGMSYYHQVPDTIDRDLTLSLDAIKNFQELINRFPASTYKPEAQDRLSECIKKLAAKEDYVGDFYFKREIWLSALPRYENLIAKYADSEFAAKAMSRAAISAYNLGDSPKAEKYLHMLEDKHSGSEELAEARRVMRR